MPVFPDCSIPSCERLTHFEPASRYDRMFGDNQIGRHSGLEPFFDSVEHHRIDLRCERNYFEGKIIEKRP